MCLNVTFQCMFMWRLGGARVQKLRTCMVFVCTAGEEKKRVRRKFGGQRDAGKKNAGSGTRKGQSVQLVKTGWYGKLREGRSGSFWSLYWFVKCRPFWLECLLPSPTPLSAASFDFAATAWRRDLRHRSAWPSSTSRHRARNFPVGRGRNPPSVLHLALGTFLPSFYNVDLRCPWGLWVKTALDVVRISAPTNTGPNVYKSKRLVLGLTYFTQWLLK